MPILQFSSQKPFPINKSTVSNPTGSKRAYTAQVSCREAAVHNGRQFKRCGLNVMRRKLVRAEAAVSRRENETRKIQLGMLCLSCTSIGNGNSALRALEIPSVARIGPGATQLWRTVSADL